MAPRKKQPSKIRQEIESIYEQNELAALKSAQNRGRSITVGQVNGGLVEVSIRSDISSLYYILHPVEVVEIMEQLAAASGVEIAKRPKQDFSAWRSWELERPEAAHWRGSAPYQMSEKDRKYILKFEEKQFQSLPSSVSDVSERPKLEATTKRKKKIEKTTEE